MASKSKNIAELLNGDVTIDATDIANDAVTTAKIADDAVTTAKINAGAVDTTELASGAVTSAKLDTNIDVAGTLDVTGTLTADSNIASSSTVTAVGGMTSSATSGGNMILATNSGTTNSDTAVFQGSAGSYYNQMFMYGSGDSYFQTNGTNLTFGTVSNSPVYIKTNNTNRMIIDNNGYVTQSKLPMFNIIGGVHTIATTGYATITSSNGFSSSQEYDPDNLFNHTNGRFTAPVAGRYFFIFSIGIIFTSGYHYSYLYKNGANISGLNRNAPQNTQIETVSIQAVLNLAAGDYITALRNNNNINGSVDGAMFSGFLLG